MMKTFMIAMALIIGLALFVPAVLLQGAASSSPVSTGATIQSGSQGSSQGASQSYSVVGRYDKMYNGIAPLNFDKWASNQWGNDSTNEPTGPFLGNTTNSCMGGVGGLGGAKGSAVGTC
jgi:hypothetical protein